MDLKELQELLHELNEEYKAKSPNVGSKRAVLIDALHPLKLTVVLVKERDISNGLDEYMIADNEELEEYN